MPLLKIPFATEELAIVRAAVELGNWLIPRNGLKESQRDAIRKAHVYLVQGVFPPAGESYSFGFDANRSDLSRSWCVALDANLLEIFSSYNPIPSYYEQD